MSTVRIQLRRGQSSDWTSVNPVLAAGEAGLESDTLQIKIGDGTTNWNDLGYATVTPTNLTNAVNAAITGTVDVNFVSITELGVANGVATLDSNGVIPDSQLNLDIERVANAGSAIATAKSQAIATAEAYTDSSIGGEVTNRNASIASAIAAEVTRANGAYDPSGAASIATTNAEAYTDTKIAALVGSAPTLLKTLQEIDAAINNDANFSTTIISDIATGVSQAKAYTDLAVTNLQSSISGAESAAISTAEAFATTAANTAQNNAESYTDTKISAEVTRANAAYDSAGSAASAQSAAISTAEAFATTAANNAQSAAITSANSYTDGKITTEVTNRNSAISSQAATTLSTAEAYTDTAKTSAISTAETFATNAVATETSRAEAAEALLAPKASPALTGTPTAPTASALTNNTQIATTAYTDSAVAAEATARATAVTNAISTAETYAATQATNAQSAATSAAETFATNADVVVLSSAKSYTDSSIATEVTNRNNAISTATTNAETYADSNASTLTNKTISGSANTLSNIPNSATTATSANTSSAIVSRDSSGNFNAHMITLTGTPVNSGDVVTKAYADTIASGMNWHQAVAAATSAVLPTSTYTAGSTDANSGTGIGATLVATANGALTIDGVSVSNGNRVLVKNQATATQNGVYTVTSNGGASAKWTLTRAVDYDNHLVAEVTPGDAVYVEYGTNNASQAFVEVANGTGTNGAIVIGTDNITFSQFTGTSAITASTGISVSGNSISVDPAVVAELTATQTLTNKTISGSSNTLSNIGNSSLTNSSVTIGSTSVALGATAATLAGLTLTSPTVNSPTLGGTVTATGVTVSNGTFSNPTVSGTLTYASGAYITFADGTTQSTAGVPSITPINTQTASLTLSSSYVKDSFVQINSASAATVTIPADSTYSYPVGASLTFQALGAGQVSFVAASGVTAQYTPGLKLRTQYSVATIQKVAANTWAIFGDLSA